MARLKGFALKLAACREALARCERDLGYALTHNIADLFLDQGLVDSTEKAGNIARILKNERLGGGAAEGTTRMRYPGNDPENGPAYLQRFTGGQWTCAGHRFHKYECDDIDDETGMPNGKTYEAVSCRYCGEPGELADA